MTLQPSTAHWNKLPENLQIDNLITLVHGTWGQESALAYDESSFSHSLLPQLPGQTVFQPFVWSGRNRHSDRLAAADLLKACVLEGVQLYPESNHFVIAHSHGGNILYYALRDAEFACTLKGVVTLSTPFIHVNRRPLPQKLRSSLDWGGSSWGASRPWILVASLMLPIFLLFAVLVQVKFADSFWLPYVIGLLLFFVAIPAVVLTLRRRRLPTLIPLRDLE